MADDEGEDHLWRAMQFRQLREEEAKHKAKPKVEQQSNGHDTVEPLALEPASILATGAIPTREFLDGANIFPHRNVAMLGGDGGTGKSLVAMQLALACTTGSAWLGLDVAQGPVIYVSAEEDRTEIKIRFREIAAAGGIDLGEAYQLYPIYMAGEDCVLAFEKNGRLETTTLYRRLRKTLEEINPVLLILDNLADVFAGNENVRSLAKQFIGVLRGLAIQYDCVVLLLAHPSLAGIASGTGTSGSTGWGNSVRVRLYMHKLDGPDADENARVLEIKKANYSAAGQRLNLSWSKGAFVRKDPANPLDAITVADVDRVKAAFASGRYRVDERAEAWGGYCVAEIADLDVGVGVAVGNRSGEQNKNRETVRRLLAIWLRAKTIFVINGKNEHNRPTKFFTSQPQEDQDDDQ